MLRVPVTNRSTSALISVVAESRADDDALSLRL
jgi:hypothetical protein